MTRERSVYVVTLEPTIAGIDPIRALRATLKFALRRFGLRAIDAYEHTTREVIARLISLRPQYSKIDDELLLQLEERLP